VLEILQQEIIQCRRCPRLCAYTAEIAQLKRRAYREQIYWGRPVPSFGDPLARVLILGLAPGAHGSNRTGRPFTGDSSGNFMYPVLHEAGFASQPTGTHRDDGLTLTNAYITAAVRCVPPQNKPTPAEAANCAPFLDREIAALPRLKIVLALGRIAFEAYLNHLKRHGLILGKKDFPFVHGAEYATSDGRILQVSYHPSNQNTQTGTLTRAMFLKVIQRTADLVKLK